MKTTKRKGCVPTLVDNKRKFLEKNLSAAQRDKLSLQEAKDDAQFRKELAQSMNKSTEVFAKSVEQISNAVTNLGNGICRSIEMLAYAMQQQPPNSQHNQYFPNQSYSKK